MSYLKRLVVLLSIILIQNSFGQSTIYVETSIQFGRGILKTRGSETYVITPLHVVQRRDGSDYFGPITIYGERNERARADLLNSYPGDLAVLRFSGEENLVYKNWKFAENYSSILEIVDKGFIELREPTGEVIKVPVAIMGNDFHNIFIKPIDSQEKFKQGMSGSSLFVVYEGKKVYLGMFQEIEDEKNGLVIRADEIDKLLGGFFNPVKKEKRSNVITDKNLVKEVDDIKYELLNINKSADKVTFTFDVTSLNKDKVVKLYYRDIFLYEDSGAEHQANKIIIGNKSSHNVEYNLVEGTSVSMKIIFSGISSSAQFATLLKVGFLKEQTKSSFEYRDLYFGDNNEVIEDEGNWSKEELGFKYELLSFEKTGTNVTFNFTVTSLNDDKIVKLYHRNIYLYDDKGLETNPYKITIGNKSSHNIEYNLVQGIRVPLEFSFKDVAFSAKGVSLLKVGFSDAQNKGVFQMRGLTFPVKTITKTKKTESSYISNTKETKSLTNCSEVYFYRKNSVLEYQATVYLYNHGELIAKLAPGVRYKTLVCDPDRSYKFSVRTNPNEVALANSKPIIEMGKKYYLKINCSAGISTIKLMDPKKGEKDVKNNAKFKRRITNLTLNEY